GWCIKAAEQGDADSQYALGRLYEMGGLLPSFRKIDRDLNKATVWYERAAGQGRREAQVWIGRTYFDQGDKEWANAPGRNPPKSAQEYWSKAYKWFLKAANQGDANAESYLGTIYFFGK